MSYAVAKVAAHHFCQHYWRTYGLWIVCGILFNHESPRRGETFVTRKITQGLARIACGLQERLVLGNLDARRDWGHAADYMAVVAHQMQRDAPEDFVIGTGVTTTVRQWLSACMAWTDVRPYRIETDGRYMRPAEVHELRASSGLSSIIVSRRGWHEVAREMVDNDLKLARAEAEMRKLTYAAAT